MPGVNPAYQLRTVIPDAIQAHDRMASVSWGMGSYPVTSEARSGTAVPPVVVLMLHELKTHPDPFGAVLDGVKTFEFRKADRDFSVDDILVLKEYHPFTAYSGRYLLRKVIYIIRGEFGIPAGYCIMSIRPLTQAEEANHAAGIEELRRDNPALSQ